MQITGFRPIASTTSSTSSTLGAGAVMLLAFATTGCPKSDKPNEAAPQQQPAASTAPSAVASAVASASATPPKAAAAPVAPWSRSFGSGDFEVSHAIAIDPQGNLVITGRFMGKGDYGTGPLANAGGSDVYVAKLDPAGKPLWARSFGSSGEDEAYAVAVDAGGNVLVTGSFQGKMDPGSGSVEPDMGGDYDVFVVKLAPDGKTTWGKRFGSRKADNSLGVAADASGNVAFTGMVRAKADFGGGTLEQKGDGSALFVARLDPQGAHAWSKSYNCSGLAIGEKVVFDSQGNLIVIGGFQGKLEVEGNTVQPAGGNDGFIAKFDPTGKMLWNKAFGGKGDDYLYGLGVDEAGNIVLAGTFWKEIDFGGGALKAPVGRLEVFIVKLDGDGNHVWSKGFGGSGDEQANAVALDPTGNIFVAGEFHGKSASFGGESLNGAGGASDAFLAKYDSKGDHLWSKAFGSNGPDSAVGVVADPLGSAVVLGDFEGKMVVGDKTLKSGARADAFVVRFAP